jgi:D-xylose transport system permease protein
MTQVTEQSALVDPETGRPAQSAGDYMRAYFQRVRAGDLGSLPIIVGLVLITAIFTYLNPVFLSPRNFVGLILQMTALTVIAIGIVFVLLLGEIDLSVSYVSGVAAIIMARLAVQAGQPFWASIGAALVTGMVIGLIQGSIITRLRVPSFIVTLAGNLIWAGAVLILLQGLGTLRISDGAVIALANSFIPPAIAYALAALFVLGYAGVLVAQRQARVAADLPAVPFTILGLRIAMLAVLVFGAIFYANQDRGVPYAGLIMVVLLVVFTFVANRTGFGRHVYAVGGNAEAARRAGIPVQRIRVAVFMIASSLAALGGVIQASRLRSVDQSVGGGDLLLNSIAAAVIGGTSLFGGRGKVISALLGALVISAVANGMALLNLSAGVRFVVTGLVLLAAVLVDSLSARSRAGSGVV